MHETPAADALLNQGAGPSLFNIAQFLPAMARAAPDRAAIVCPHRADSLGRRSLTFRALDTDSDRLAWGLREVGVTPGLRTLLMVRPGVEFVSVTFALFKLGAVPVLIDSGMGLDNLLNCVRQSRPGAMIAIPLAHAVRNVLGNDAFDSVAINITVGRRWFWGGITLKHVRTYGSDKPFPIAETTETSPAAVLFTSGGTGIPKGVLYEHGMFGAQVKLIRDFYRIEPGEIDLPAFPLFGLFGAALGTTCIIPDMDPSRPAQCDPAKLVDALQSQHVTYTFGSPAIWRRVAPYCLARNITFPSVKRILMAGAPVRAEVLEPFTRILPNGDTYIPYGATEALPVASIRGSEVLNETWDFTRRGKGYCVGRPLPGLTVKILNATRDFASPQMWNDALALPPGSIGEIVVKGAVVTKEYFDMPKQTALAKIYEVTAPNQTPPIPPFQGGENNSTRASHIPNFQHSPAPTQSSVVSPQSSPFSPQSYSVWHRIGDMGYFDVSGRLWFCGRKAHRVILRSGRVLYSVCIEAVFENFLTPRMTGNEMKSVRAALTGIGPTDAREGVIVVELPQGKSVHEFQKLTPELNEWAADEPLAADIVGIFGYTKSFPVDVRHNAKIDREKLGRWAGTQLALHWQNPVYSRNGS
jgi:acyl-CoA synthetase (AMP-forming)/AMP-acid ligase II